MIIIPAATTGTQQGHVCLEVWCFECACMPLHYMQVYIISATSVSTNIAHVTSGDRQMLLCIRLCSGKLTHVIMLSIWVSVSTNCKKEWIDTLGRDASRFIQRWIDTPGNVYVYACNAELALHSMLCKKNPAGLCSSAGSSVLNCCDCLHM